MMCLPLLNITSRGRAQKKAKAGKNVGCAGTGNKDDIRLQARKIRKPQADASLSHAAGKCEMHDEVSMQIVGP